jgi:DNA-binding PadR family transcriptional regulator
MVRRALALKYAILGFLRTTPRSGYDLARRFKDTMGGLVWMAQLSQIYPELRRLEEQKLIEGSVVKGERLEKRVYRLTEAGRNELRHWVETQIEPAPVRDVQRLQFLLLDSSDPALIRRHLERHREHHRQRLETLEEKLRQFGKNNPLLNARLAATPPTEHATIVAVRRAALEGDADRAQLEIEWADKTLAALAKLAKRRGAAPRPRRPRQKR